MPEGGGLFSGLKFTDVFFPAAAAAASAYNPYIGRGLQTGLNVFNSMASFQDSARYYKHLKEQQEREDVGLERADKGFAADLARLRGQETSFFDQQRALDRGGPILDEGETSKFSIFGEGGPELPDPDQAAVQQQSLGGMTGESPDQFGLGMEALENPRFSDINMAESVMSEEDQADLEALQAQIAQQELQRSFLLAAPGAAINQSGMSAYRALDERYRVAERIKDLQSNMEFQEEQARLGVLERQAQVRQAKEVSDIHREAQREHEAWVDRNTAAQMGAAGEGGLSASAVESTNRYIYNAYLSAVSPGNSQDTRDASKERAITQTLRLMQAGLPVPDFMQNLMAEYLKEQDKLAAKEGGLAMVTQRNAKQETVVPKTHMDKWLDQFKEPVVEPQP